MRSICILLVASLFGCDPKPDDTSSPDTGAPDCEPTAEVCDGEDNDCDGIIDNDVMTDYYADADGDGYGAGDATEACEPPSGTVEDSTDCDDSDVTAYPGNEETCDGIDNNCDGAVDEGVTTTFYADSDGDGFGDVDGAVESCTLPADHVENSEDCDDADPSISPAAHEFCDAIDNDCDPKTSESGTISFISADGVWSDVTTDFVGTEKSVGLTALTEDGTYQICEGTWFERFTVEANVDLVGIGAAELVVVSGDDASGSLISIAQDGLTVSVENLTLTRGFSSGVLLGGGYRGGGGIYCLGNSELYISDAIIDGNSGNTSAGLYSEDCTVDISTTDITNNVSDYVGAGITITGGTTTMVDSLVEGNDAPSAGGMLIGDYTKVPAALIMENSLFTGNTGSYSAAIEIERGSTVECTGDKTTTAGIIANVASSGSVVQIDSGTIVSNVCDWGESGTKDDNTESDLSASETNYGDDASFTCTESGCK